ncbi:glycosyltransferase family 2 protein [Leptospira sp. 'Mane']
MEVEIKTVAICVLFKTESSFFENLRQFCLQCDSVILIDNGCDKKFESDLRKTITKYDKKIIYHKNETNVGLAIAQNTGIEIAKKLKPSSVIFFDDDSVPENGMVRLLGDFIKKNPNTGLVAPDVKHSSGGIQKYWVKQGLFWKRRSFQQEETALLEVNTVISSGSMVPMRILKELGGMREDYFIDYIDIEFCLRIRKAGYKIAVIKEANLHHHLGDRQSWSGLGINIFPTNHSALRKYYMTRNRIRTWRLYAAQLPYWFLIDLGNFFFDSFRTFVLEKEKIAKTKAILVGFWDGWKS